MADTRTRYDIEVEIAAARVAFLAADEIGDFTTADEQYRRLDLLLDLYRRVPAQRRP